MEIFRDKELERNNIILKPQENTVEYFYQEEEQKRNLDLRKIDDTKHISLALQGGGVKGVEYVGAYKALLDSMGSA